MTPIAQIQLATLLPHIQEVLGSILSSKTVILGSFMAFRSPSEQNAMVAQITQLIRTHPFQFIIHYCFVLFQFIAVLYFDLLTVSLGRQINRILTDDSDFNKFYGVYLRKFLT